MINLWKWRFMIGFVMGGDEIKLDGGGKGGQCTKDNDCKKHCSYRGKCPTKCFDGYCLCNCASPRLLSWTFQAFVWLSDKIKCMFLNNAESVFRECFYLFSCFNFVVTKKINYEMKWWIIPSILCGLNKSFGFDFSNV